MKTATIIVLLLLSFSGFATSIDTIPKNFEIGIGIKKDTYLGNNFINKSFNNLVGITLDASLRLERNYFIGLSYSYNFTEIKTTEYVGNIHKAVNSELEFIGKKKILILDKLGISPKIGLGTSNFKYFIYNDNLTKKTYKSNGFTLDFGSDFSYQFKKNINFSLSTGYKHIYFYNMKASEAAGTNYKSTEVIYVGSKVSINL